MMQRVQLHGLMAEKYGQLPPMDVRDPAEAMRALACQLPDFMSILREQSWYVVLENEEGKWALDEYSLTHGMDRATLHIIPAVEGAASNGGKGTAKLVIGVALIGASLFVPGMQGFGLAAAKTAWAAKIGVAGITFGHMALAGVALAFAGAAMMIAPQPTMPNADKADDTNSFVFGGDNKPSGQGLAVPCVWGRWRAVPIPVATRIETNQVMIGSTSGGGTAYTNYPTGYDPGSGLTPEEFVQQTRIDPWANSAN